MPNIDPEFSRERFLTEAVNLPANAELAAVRNQFPVFNKKIYLNSCSQGALSDAVEVRFWNTSKPGTRTARHGIAG